jgi:hypothetical protein
MSTMLIVLWCVYLTDCIARMERSERSQRSERQASPPPREWWFRGSRPGRMRATSSPDAEFLNGRFACVWLPLLPWHVAFAAAGAGDDPGDPNLDLDGARTRLDAIRHRTRHLLWAVSALFVLLLVILPLLVMTDRLLGSLRVWGPLTVAAWAAALITFIRAHRAVHSRAVSMELMLTVGLSPLSLIRARVAVLQRALQGLHPLTAAGLLCDDEELVRVARLWWYDAPDRREAIARIARTRSLEARLTELPTPGEPHLTKYCPRCQATYAAFADECRDCPQVPLSHLTHA